MPVRGSQAVLVMGHTNVEANGHEVTAEGLGCTGLTIGTGTPARVVPGGPATSRESSEIQDTTGSFTIDCNPVTQLLFAGASGTRWFFWWYPEGKVTGKPKEEFAGYIATTLNMPVNDAMTFAVSIFGDSAVVKSTV